MTSRAERVGVKAPEAQPLIYGIVK